MTLEKSFIEEEMPILRLSSENRLSAATTSLESTTSPLDKITCATDELVETESTEISLIIVKLSEDDALLYKACLIRLLGTR